GSGILKVIRMSSKRLYLIVLMLAIGCQQAGISVNKSTLAANATKEVSAGAKPDEQLEINKNTLLQGPSEEIRIKAATVMLGSENLLARKILIDALVQTKNSAARMAVCKALSQSRSMEGEIKKKEDFIQPLLGVFATEVAAEAQLAADATRSFEYNQIGESLESITRDSSKSVKMRINAINALKLWPDKEAIIRLMRLVDDPEKLVSAEAEKVLVSLGMPVGESYWARQTNIEELQRKGPDEFLREWINRQGTQMRQLRMEVKSWQDKYLSSQGTIYDGLSDDVAKGNFLKGHLGNSEARIKLWALDKVYQWQFASGSSKLPAELEPILLNLISNPDTEVKLKTLGLVYLRRMDSAKPLLSQLKSESNDQVKIALLDALGGACSNALSVKPAKITPEVRKQALEFAKQFLSEEDTVKARKGAEVLRKLLEPNGLKPEELEEYLGLLVKRYNQQKEKPDSALRGELLSAMADLCAQRSASRDIGAKLFKPLFIEALGDKTDLVRETAVDGLIYIDKADAFKRLRTKFFDDSSEILRKKLIGLAGEVGGKEDLPNLAGKIGSNSESGPAWQAMLKIFDGSDSVTLSEWMGILTAQDSKIKLSSEQKIAFLKKAEAKANGDKKIHESVIEKLAELYYTTGQFERAAEYLDRQYKAASTAAGKDAILRKLLDASLRGSKVDLAVKLVEERLVKEDLGPENVVIKSIDTFMNKPSGAEPNVVLRALRGVKFSGARPKWQQWLNRWASRLGESKDGEKPKEGAKANKA
ncbi:MAG: HEAT repeat domain-containing protein, partial [Planctomycetota bacterium]